MSFASFASFDSLNSFTSSTYTPIAGGDLQDLNQYDNTGHITQISIPYELVDFFFKLKQEGIDVQTLHKICSKNLFKSIDKVLLSYDYLLDIDNNNKKYASKSKETYDIITSFILEKNVTDIICDYKTEMEYAYVFNGLIFVFGADLTKWDISAEQINFFSDDFNLYFFKRLLNTTNFEKLFNPIIQNPAYNNYNNHIVNNNSNTFAGFINNNLVFAGLPHIINPIVNPIVNPISNTNNKFNYIISLINITEDIFDYINKNHSKYVDYYSIFNKYDFLQDRIYDNIEKIEFENIIKLLKQYPLNLESIIEKFNFDTQLILLIINNDIILSEDFFYNNEMNIDDSVYSLFSSKVQLSEKFIRLYDDKINWNEMLDKKYLSRDFLKMYKEQVFNYYFQSSFNFH